VTVTHPFGSKTLAAGTVVGHTEGLYDFGGPESGPSPVEPAPLVIVACDDGRTRRAYVGDCTPEDGRWP
jgi:hypothetical protein